MSMTGQQFEGGQFLSHLIRTSAGYSYNTNTTATRWRGDCTDCFVTDSHELFRKCLSGSFRFVGSFHLLGNNPLLQYRKHTVRRVVKDETSWKPEEKYHKN